MHKEGERLIPINIVDEMRTSYIDYSMSVIVSRALPDVRDFLGAVLRSPHANRRSVLAVVVDDLLDPLPDQVVLVLRAVAAKLGHVAVPLIARHPRKPKIGLGLVV